MSFVDVFHFRNIFILINLFIQQNNGDDREKIVQTKYAWTIIGVVE